MELENPLLQGRDILDVLFLGFEELKIFCKQNGRC